MTDSLVCMCACVRHGIHAHSTIESIPDSAADCMYTIQWVRQNKAICCPAGTEYKLVNKKNSQ